MSSRLQTAWTFSRVFLHNGACPAAVDIIACDYLPLMSHTTLELRLTGSLKCSLRTAAKPSSFVKEWPYMSACVDCETKGNSVQKDDFELSVLLSACIVWTFCLPQISLTHLAIHYFSLYSVAAIAQINP